VTKYFTRMLDVIDRLGFSIWLIIGAFLLSGAIILNDWKLPGFKHYYELADVKPVDGFSYVGRLSNPDLSSHENPSSGVLLEKERVHISALMPSIPFAERVNYVFPKIIEKRFPNWLGTKERTLYLGNQLHDDIQNIGLGRFSVWHGQLYFSSSDNTDPQVNGCSYAYRDFINLSIFSRWLIGIIAIVSLSIILIRYRIYFFRTISFVRALYKHSKLAQNIFPGLVISVCILILLVVGAEIYLRSKIPFTSTHWPSRFDERFGFNFVPNAVVKYTNNINFWTVSKVNSLGFLDREPVIPKPDKVFRILFVGDSFIEAAQVPLRKRIQIQVENLIKNELPDFNLDTVAFGYSGTEQTNQLSFYDTFGQQVKPDLVILVIVNNDMPNNSVLLEAVRYGFHPEHPFREFYWRENNNKQFQLVTVDPNWEDHKLMAGGQTQKIMQTNRLVELKKNHRYEKWFIGWQYPDDLEMEGMFHLKTKIPIVQESIDATEWTLMEFKKRAARDNFKLLLVASDGLTRKNWVPPYRKDEYDERGQVKVIEEIADRLDLPLIDLFPIFEKNGGIEQSHFSYDGHWNSTGHQWAAEAVVDYILEHPELLESQ